MKTKNKYQVVFDLFTGKEYERLLKNKYGKSLSKMYEIIKKHFIENDFSWIEGSTYQSNIEITNKKLNDIIDNLYLNNLWLSRFTKDLKRTIIKEEEYDYNKVIKLYQKELNIQELKNDYRFGIFNDENNEEEPPKLKR